MPFDVEAAADAMNEAGWTCEMHEPDVFKSCAHCYSGQMELAALMAEAGLGVPNEFRLAIQEFGRTRYIAVRDQKAAEDRAAHHRAHLDRVGREGTAWAEARTVSEWEAL